MAVSELQGEVVHVAVGDDQTTSRSLLKWSISYFPGKNLRIVHVYRPQKFNILGGKFSRKAVSEEKVEHERHSTQAILDQYITLCANAGVKADKIFFEAKGVEEGLVKLIAERNIRWLVVGAAASHRYTMGMRSIVSRKAIYLFEHAPPTCKIWFACNGFLINSRKAVVAGSCPSHTKVAPFVESEDAEEEEGGGGGEETGEEHDFSDLADTKVSLLQHLDEAIAEAENCGKELQEAQKRCSSAELKVSAAVAKAMEWKSLFLEDLRVRSEVEEAQRREKENQAKLKSDRDDQERELQNALEQKFHLEQRMAECDGQISELEKKIKSMADAMEEFEKLRRQHEDLLQEVMELRDNPSISTFSMSEIEEATCNFDPSRIIGKGGYGFIYKGHIRNTEVAVKVLHKESKQGPSEYRQEVKVLGTMRHPNIISLIGVCPGIFTLIYEYLPNGNLEDRLNCKDDSPPLCWQTRVRIAIELCSALLFLHSKKNDCIVHGDLKPSNILLDANMVTKLSDFGICRLLKHAADSGLSRTMLATTPKGSFAYIDPEFLQYGELTPKSDVYAFGMVLLRMVTGRPVRTAIRDAKFAVESDIVGRVLDTSAGEWPMALAGKLIHIAIKCCDGKQENRPNLVEVWSELAEMRSSVSSTSSGQVSEEVPSYFKCPITQEIMRDPQVAADGYTYEAEVLRRRFNGGEATSPVTKVKLSHFDLVPNLALRSSIQQWIERYLLAT